MDLDSLEIEELQALLDRKKIKKKKEKDRKERTIKLEKKLSFSERFITSIVLVCGLGIMLGILYSFKYQSDMVMDRVVIVIGSVLGTSIPFFIWKEKNENTIKIKNNPNFDLEEYANNVADEILKDL